MKKLCVLLLSLVMVATLTFIGAPTAFAESGNVAAVNVTAVQNSDYALKVLQIVNKERAANGLQPLVIDSELQDAAMLRAMETLVYWDHTRPDGTSCFSVSDKVMGENIAYGQGSPASVMSSWMDSPGHRANILGSRFRSIGIGCVYFHSAYYWVQDFGEDTGDGIAKAGKSKVTQPVQVQLSLVKPVYDSSCGKRVSLSDTDGVVPKIVTDTSAGWYEPFAFDSSDFDYSSSNEKIFTVGEDGRILPAGTGSAVYTAALKSDPSVKAAATITVYQGRPPKLTIYNMYSPSKGRIKVSWLERSCSGYQIRYSNSPYFTSSSTITTSSDSNVSRTLNNLTSGKTYYIKVRAYNLVEGKRVYGYYSLSYAVYCK